MLTGWHHQIIPLNDVNVRYSETILTGRWEEARRQRRQQSPEIISSRNSEAEAKTEREASSGVTISRTRHIWYHFALLAPAPLVFPQSLICTMLFPVTGPMHMFFLLWKYLPSPICSFHFYSFLSFLYSLFSQLLSLARLTSPPTRITYSHSTIYERSSPYST